MKNRSSSICAVASMLLFVSVVHAQPKPPAAGSQVNPAMPAQPQSGFVRPSIVVAVLPLTAAGAVDGSSESQVFLDGVAKAASGLGYAVVPSEAVVKAAKAAKKTGLLTCEADSKCLIEAGKFMGATVVVSGEVGGLTGARLVYLQAFDVTAGKQLGSTTAKVESNEASSRSARGAMIRLFAPEQFSGKLALTVDTAKATIYVNGNKVGTSPAPPITLPVGTHAIRVTHPEYRDFVRFVDVDYDEEAKLPVALSQYPVVQNTVVEGRKTVPGAVINRPARWYRRWYTVAGTAAVLLLVGVAIGRDGTFDLNPDDTRVLPAK